MIRGVLSLIVRMGFVLLGTALATFSLLWNAPGDAAEAIAMARYDALLTPDVIDIVREQAGLNQGFWQAFFAWARGLLSFDFGVSSVTGREVLPDLRTALSYTAPLALGAAALGFLIALPLAILAARRPGGFVDKVATALASLGAAIPAFLLGLLLILLFAVYLDCASLRCKHLKPRHPACPYPRLGVAASLTRIIRSSIWRRGRSPFCPLSHGVGLALGADPGITSGLTPQSLS